MTELDTDWPEVGMLVAEYRTGSGSDWVGFSVIDRLTATQIVLSNGERYNRTTLRKVGGADKGSWHYDTLERGDSPRVMRTVTAQIVSDTLYRISAITRNHTLQGTAILDEAERLIQKARTKIAQLGKEKP
jgi:hypothetical protein